MEMTAFTVAWEKIFVEEKHVLVVTESTEGDDFIPIITKIGSSRQQKKREVGGTPEILDFLRMLMINKNKNIPLCVFVFTKPKGQCLCFFQVRFGD